MGRSEGMLQVLQRVYGRMGWGRMTRTELDGHVAPQLGSMLAGLSVLVENKKRRGEMALYVATRALCATVDQILPRWLRRRILANRWVSIWVERISFSISIGLIISAVSSLVPSLLENGKSKMAFSSNLMTHFRSSIILPTSEELFKAS